MLHSSRTRVLLLVLILILIQYSEAIFKNEKGIKSSVFLSPEFVLGPGSVENKYYSNIDFPRGHIAIKSFNAEVVDQTGKPIPLQETYLHHWVVARYYQRIDGEVGLEYNGHRELKHSDTIFVRNSGICQNNSVGQYFGLGSETRKTFTHVPDPYGIEIGDPTQIPEGYEERWMLNVHAIDTRGVEDKLACTECRCDLYNVTVDEYDRPLRPEYEGGLLCCYDKTQCRLRQGFVGYKRSLYLRYTIKWVDWDDFILPVKIYIFDVTDTEKRLNASEGPSLTHHCHVEYNVDSCDTSDVAKAGCIHDKRTSLTMSSGGYVIYGVAHQHSGGIGSTLYGEDGQVICSSVPTYGKGVEAGDEAGYIVGMSTCYPPPGSVKIVDGETLVLISQYNSMHKHTGVMGLFYILVADQLPMPKSFISRHTPILVHQNISLSNFVWMLALVGVVITIVAGVRFGLRKERGDNYEPILT